MCKYRSINDTTFQQTTLVGDVDNGGVYACVGQGPYRESICLPLNFAVNLNCSLKRINLKSNYAIINEIDAVVDG